MELTIPISPEWSKRLKAMAKKRGMAINDLVNFLVAKGILTDDGNVPSDEEVKAAVRLGLGPGLWREYAELKAKRRKESLTEPEQSRLIELSDQVEMANVNRMGYLSLMAELQEIPLATLVEKYTRGPLPYV